MPGVANTKNQGFPQTVLAASDQQGSSCSMKKSRQQIDQGSSLARVVFLVVILSKGVFLVVILSKGKHASKFSLGAGSF